MKISFDHHFSPFSALLFSFFFLYSSFLVQAQPILTLERYQVGFIRPVDIAAVGENDPRLFIVEKRGIIWILDENGDKLENPFIDIRDRVRDNSNEQGLLGLTFHPNFQDNGFFFVTYTNSSGNTRISRFERSASDVNSAVKSSEKTILTVIQPFSNHNGGDLVFGPDGYLYIGLGDGGSGGDPDGLAQNPQNLNGKMLRLDVDNGDPYGIPADNPFVGAPAIRDEIWALGLRNPWRFSFDRMTGDMWIGDVGQNALEEISFQPAGQGGINYGWDCREGNNVFNAPSPLCASSPTLTPPVFQYNRTQATGGKSVTGGFVYRGDDFPLLKGHYVCADYEFGRFWTIFKDGAGDANPSFNTIDQGKPLDFRSSKSVTTFGENHLGELFLATDSDGIIYRVGELCSGFIPEVIQTDNQLASSIAAESYQWYFNDAPLSDSVGQEIFASQDGQYSIEISLDNGCQIRSANFAYVASGIKEALALPIKVFPNPAQNIIGISFDAEMGQSYQVTMYDLQGREVYSQGDVMTSNFQIAVPALVAGLYSIRISGKKVFAGKVRIQR